MPRSRLPCLLPDWWLRLKHLLRRRRFAAAPPFGLSFGQAISAPLRFPAYLEVISNHAAHDHAVRGCASQAIAQMAGFAGLHPQAWARLTLKGSFRRSFVVHFHYSLIVLNRLLSTPSHDDAVTDPSPPHIANSAGETFTRLITAFTDAHLSLYLLTERNLPEPSVV